jgi:hypothetical protein
MVRPVIGLVTLLLAASAFPFDAVTLADYTGAEVFQRFCASCRGEAARGDGRGLVDAHGGRTMPVWGYEFRVEEGADREAEQAMHELIDKLVDYLRTLQTDSN